MPRRPRDNSPEATWDRGWRSYNSACRLSHTERLDEATAKFAEAAKLFRAAGDEPAVALCIRLMGVLYLNRNDPAQALELLREALSVAEAAGDQAGVFNVYMTLADGASAAQDIPAAIGYLEQAQVIGQELGSPLAAAVTARLQELRVASHSEPQRTQPPASADSKE